MRSKLLIEGDCEYADSPAKVNRYLFDADAEVVWEELPVSLPGVLRVQIGSRPMTAVAGTRLLITVKLWTERGTVVVQPLYRSSGVATPGKSPVGTWWPTSGLYTQAYCEDRGIDLKHEGYIGKHFTYRGNWISHRKERERVHPVLNTLCDELAILIPE